MDHYLDINIQPDAEMRENVLLNKVYTKLHKALYTLQATDIGVSFPDYQIKLGRTLRIHAKAKRLEELQKINWLGGLSGYCLVSVIATIPEQVSYRVISRIQSNMTEAKLRRLKARGTITEENSKLYKAKMFAQGMDNPYLELESTSNGHAHRRYLAFGDIVDKPQNGSFDAFGLSKSGSIPWF